MELAVVVVFALAVTLVVMYVVIKSAVRAALLDHYKTVRWYERTGEWLVGPFRSKDAPRPFARAKTPAAD
jgi:hypothetical protein